MSSSDTTDPEWLSCQRCGVQLRPGSGNFFHVTIAAVAGPTPPTFSKEDLAGDLRQKIEQLLAQLEGVSEQEALDQVHRRLAFWLCNRCFHRWIEDPTG